MAMPANTMEKQYRNFRVELEDGIATVLIDEPDEKVNVIAEEAATEFNELVGVLDQDPVVKAIVLASGKKDGFVAGADIKMLQKLTTAKAGEEGSRALQAGFDRLAALKKPVVAAIHGACLGGGLEWAMACHYRIASDDPRTVLGLPETQIGLIPAAGGTQRLPRLVGIQNAIELITTGKHLKAKKAKGLGLVDEVVPAPILLMVAKRRAAEGAAGALKREGPQHGVKKLRKEGAKAFTDAKAVTEAVLEDNRLGREVLFRQAKKAVLARTHGHYPAVEKVIDVIRTGADKGFQKGLAAEAKLFGELVVGDVAKNLMGIFFATTALKKDTGVDDRSVKPREVKKVGVLGGGLMGGGITYVTVNAGVPVRIKDKDDAGVARGFAYVGGIFDERVKKKSMTALEKLAKMRLLTATTGYEGFGGADLVIEAVFEELEVKHAVLRELEAVNDHAIFASNTSTIPITKIAEASKHPERVLGMHYFSPVHKMPLLEVIVHAGTSPEATVTAVALGKKQGKTVIVVNDGPGFYTSRILAPYVNEAAHLLIEGAPIEEIDRALVDWGFPVGPITLLDEVGIDVAQHAGETMHEAFAERMSSPEALAKVIEDGRKGRKNQKGFYKYEDGKKTDPDESVYRLMPGWKKKSVPQAEIAERVSLQMVNEAIRCLGEGILRSPRDGDVGAMFGLGFPPFRGGPFRYADAVGAGALYDRIEKLHQRFGARFEPAPLLAEHAKSNQPFYKGQSGPPPSRGA